MYGGSKTIINPSLAKGLLRLGFTIIDLRPQIENSARTVFIFKWTDEIDQAVRKLTTRE